MLGFLFTWKAALAGMGVAVLAGFWAGYDYRDAKCDAAEVRGQLAAKQIELDVARADLRANALSEEFIKRALNIIDQNVADRQQIMAGFEDARNKLPEAQRCLIDADGVRWLRRIAPR